MQSGREKQAGSGPWRFGRQGFDEDEKGRRIRRACNGLDFVTGWRLLFGNYLPHMEGVTLKAPLASPAWLPDPSGSLVHAEESIRTRRTKDKGSS